ncbi:transcription initiation factor IIA subunit 2-like [Scaptodrosophila lebanonensis]|uniref:Transcription initiation factor IIA subunit 2 n=1 Tax=Drosophila lebanonensis TaxID=7225 RepID=A0A6J2U470_DROLE|nr:transcription initiation factor IIA subunit 2-like [Scaptodrosophila lebanonensis]
MAYQMYRASTLGKTLQDTIEEFMQWGQIPQSLAYKMLLQYDLSVNKVLPQRAHARVTFKARKLENYRCCDNVWTLILSDVTFCEQNEFLKIDRLKIVSCDGRVGACR